MNEPRFCEEYLGYKLYFQGISYNCPALALYGFSYDTQLKSAIRRKLKLNAKKQAALDTKKSGIK